MLNRRRRRRHAERHFRGRHRAQRRRARGLSLRAAAEAGADDRRLLRALGRLLAKTLREFERESGAAVAYDAYGDPARTPSMMKEAPYDVVILPGPALARAVAGTIAQD